MAPGGPVYYFDPAADTVTPLAASTAPWTTRLSSAVWDGSNAFVFGGDGVSPGPNQQTNAIVRFTPGQGTVQPTTSLMPDKLPFGRDSTSAVWTGWEACIFGGALPGGNLTDQIVCYGGPPPSGGSGSGGGGSGSGSAAGNASQASDPFFSQLAHFPVGLVCPGTVVQFEDQGAGGVAWSWQFGDGSVGTGERSVHAFGRTGVFAVNLTAVAGNGSILRSTSLVTVADLACKTVPDYDRDGIQDQADNCPDVPNRDQRDSDRDGIGDACDPTPCHADTLVGVPPQPGGVTCSPNGCPRNDVQGYTYWTTPCLASQRPVAKPKPGDRDGDGIPDKKDNCPNAYNPDQADLDGDGIGDVCDSDMDGDGIKDKLAPGDPLGTILDNCPRVPNPDQRDSIGDGVGDACRHTSQRPAVVARYSAPAVARSAQQVSAWLLALGMCLLVMTVRGRRR
ncbi:MAG: thrombospondin type 3 repeat-containing protein [Thermoplasmatota archaeon]